MSKIISRNVIIFILLTLLIVLVLLWKGHTPFGKNNSSFAPDTGKEITKIEFSCDNSKLLLEKRSDSWVVNGNSEARKSAVLYILHILEGMKIKSPVSPELFKTEVTDKDIKPVKVRLFEGNRLIKTYLVYKTASNNYGNIMKMRDKAKPFIVYVPGYDGNIGSGFVMDELFWKPYTVFNLLPSEISSVTLENIYEPSSSFSVTNVLHRYTVSDMNNKLAGFDSSRVKRYLSYFIYVPFESWAFDISEQEKNKILNSSPLFRITVRKNDGTETMLTLWERLLGGNNDSDRLWAKTGRENEIFIIRYPDIDPVLKKRSYFFP